MSLWTKRHKIPGVSTPFSYAKSTVVDGKIWTMCEIKNEGNDESFQIKLYVFDPESEVVSEMNCIYPAIWPQWMHTFIAYKNDVYIWRELVERRQYQLYQLNRATLEWESIMSVRRTHLWKSVIITEQGMHILGVDNWESEFLLITIDLTMKVVVKRQVLQSLIPRRGKAFLSTHNNELYVMQDHYNHSREVFLIKNGYEIMIAQEELNDDNPLHEAVVQCADSIAYRYKRRKLEVRKFDFESMKWETNVTSPDWILPKIHIQLQSAVKVNGSIYVLLQILGEERHFGFHELDLHPKLTAICLADLTGRLSEKKDGGKLDEVKKQLSIQMRAKLAELLDWRDSFNSYFRNV